MILLLAFPLILDYTGYIPSYYPVYYRYTMGAGIIFFFPYVLGRHEMHNVVVAAQDAFYDNEVYKHLYFAINLPECDVGVP